MTRDSVFFKLAKDENSFTELLCNLLVRDDFGVQVLPLLCPKTPPSSLAGATITTQEIDKDCGRPDIVIRTDEACGLVEVKLDPRRGLTNHQKPGCGYHDYLMKQNVLHRQLLFLVPANWEHSEILQSCLPLNDFALKVKVRICFWEHILRATEKDTDPIVQEFRKVLMCQLKSVTFSSQETVILRSQEFSTAFRAVRKIQIIVDKLHGLMGRAQASWEKTELESYGFNVELNGKCQLWFGIWEISGKIRLCYALPQLCDAATREAFCQLLQNGEVESNVGTDKKWIVATLSDKLLQADDPVGQIKKQLDVFLEKLAPDSVAAKSD